jgi:tetratricopeptide (TPR) repeat protein
VAFASTESAELTQQGVTELRAGHYAAALTKLKAAEKADATDAEALFYEGVALNRTGHFTDALAKLQKAKDLGSTQGDLAFEMGWALVGTGKNQEAIDQLTQYEAAHPGRAQTSEFMGRAYVGLGDYDKAETYFAEAIQRDPATTPTVTFYRARIAQLHKQPDVVANLLQSIAQNSPESPLGQVLRNQVVIDPSGGITQKQAYNIFGSLGLGYNSNVLFAGENASEQGDWFTAAALDADYNWYRKNGDSIRVGYDFIGNIYFSESGGNLLDNTVYAAYNHAFSKKWLGNLRLSDNFTFLGNDFYRNSIAIRPAIGYRYNENHLTELAYSFADNNYRDQSTSPVAAVNESLDRDSKTQTLSLTHFFTLPGAKLQGRIGVFGVDNSADGDSYDYEGLGMFIGLRREIARKIVGDIFYSRSDLDYDHPNALTTPLFSENRHDKPDYIAVQLLRPLRSNLDLYLRYAYNRSNSNITYYDYKQHVISLGVNKVF